MSAAYRLDVSPIPVVDMVGEPVMIACDGGAAQQQTLDVVRSLLAINRWRPSQSGTHGIGEEEELLAAAVWDALRAAHRDGGTEVFLSPEQHRYLSHKVAAFPFGELSDEVLEVRRRVMHAPRVEMAPKDAGGERASPVTPGLAES